MSPTPDPRTAARSQLIRLLAERLVRDVLASVRSEVSRNERGVRARLGELTKEIDNLVGSIAVVGISPAIAARLKAAEAEKAAIEAQLASQSPAATTAAVEIEAMWLRDMRKYASDKAGSLDAAADLLQHSSKEVTRKHYQPAGTRLKTVR